MDLMIFHNSEMIMYAESSYLMEITASDRKTVALASEFPSREPST